MLQSTIPYHATALAVDNNEDNEDNNDSDDEDDDDSDGHTDYGDLPFQTIGAAHVHSLYTINEPPPPLIDGPPPFFDYETESVGTDHSNGTDVYGYDDEMPALEAYIDSDEGNNFDKIESVGTDHDSDMLL
mgnify:CR=1 FL=1